jgi:DNA-binding CsgD family transcriptional regulator
MGAVEHLKTLCCLGLRPESAMVAVTPLLHEIIPHGWTRMALIEPDATISSGYGENPAATALYRERLWRLMEDPSGPGSLWLPAFRAVGIGWTLHRQGRGYTESAWYREIEAPLDSCWFLDAMIGEDGRTIGMVNLTRPRSARPFSVDDVRRLDELRPWLAHALRRPVFGDTCSEDRDLAGVTAAPVMSGQLVLTSDATIVFQTPGLEHLLRILAREPGDFTRHVPLRDRLPAPILKLLLRLTDAANGSSGDPPRMQLSTAYGILTLEAKWLKPAATLPEDVARDPKSCLIGVKIELCEHAVAHAARVLREGGATPAQLKVGILLALGKTKPLIASELGIRRSSVEGLTKKLYQTLHVHNSAELGAKIWLGAKPAEIHVTHVPKSRT